MILTALKKGVKGLYRVKWVFYWFEKDRNRQFQIKEHSSFKRKEDLFAHIFNTGSFRFFN